MLELNMDEASYSVLFRLQRSTTESAFVSVLVTKDLIIEKPDGTSGLDVEKLAQRAVEMGQSSALDWDIENQSVNLHPIQVPGPKPRNGKID